MNTPAPPVPSSGRRRQSKNLLKLSRSPIVGRLAVVNHFKRAVDTLAPTTKFPRAKALLSSNIWPWIRNYLKYVFERKYPFPSYHGEKYTGVYRITPPPGSDTIRMGLAGDWATGTDESHTIADLIQSASPDFTIHLGDVYYVGDTEEIEQNCLGEPHHGYDGVKWPKGTQGSFALNGNHEMYANGKPYFRIFLKTLGMKDDPQGQPASFFCLEADRWRIIAIDTGYNSIGMPILGVLPIIKEIPLIGGDCHLEAPLIEWLRNVVRPRENRKLSILLSHHQYFSAFPEQNYHKPAKQLAEFFEGQELVWLWGHEHRLGIYDKFTTPEGITFYGRCVGHAGMPIDLAEPDKTKAPLTLYDRRSHNLDDETVVGENGFVNLTIQSDVLTLDYRDIRNTSLLVETFSTGTNGSLSHTSHNPGILSSP